MLFHNIVDFNILKYKDKIIVTFYKIFLFDVAHLILYYSMRLYLYNNVILQG